MKTGVECEFFLLAPDGRAVGDAVDTAAKPCYDQSALMRHDDVITETCDSMLELGRRPYQNDHEDANGRFEMNPALRRHARRRRPPCLLQVHGQVDRREAWPARHLHAQAVRQPDRRRRPRARLPVERRQERLRGRQGRLGLSRTDALRLTDGSKLPRSELGGEFVDSYVKLKTREWNDYARRFTDWERANTLDC